jgi:O-antigen ligase
MIWREKKLQIFFTAASFLIFMAQVLTNSRAGLLGFVITAAIFLILLGTKSIKQNVKILSVLGIGFLAITVIFGTTLFSRIGNLVTKNHETSQAVDQNLPTTNYQPPTTSAPTESWQIRLIVWQGAVKAFSKRPILGWGPETFAYSYYLFRPTSHNNTTEWNFFYNKTHNEFLNYLANIGLLGTVAYIALLAACVWTFYGKVKKNDKVDQSIFPKAAIASLLGYQATIFFGFSTVATALTSYLLIAAVLIIGKNQKLQSFKIKMTGIKTKFILSAFIAVIGLFALTIPLRFYFADLFIERAKKLDPQDFDRSLIAYDNAVTLFPAKNPFYLADATYAMAIYATTTDDNDLAKNLAIKTNELSKSALKLSPSNLIITRRVASSYLLISQIDQNFGQNALLLGQRLAELAPTDPQSYLSLAKIQAGLDQKEEAKKTLQTALNLKPDYQEAQELLDQLDSKTIQ